MRIAVIGTGVVGALFLDCLATAPGFTLIGFDRAEPAAQEDAGTGLNLGPNALKALRLYAPARHAELRAASLPWRRWITELVDGTRLLDLDLLSVAEEPGARLRWADLYRLLRRPIASRTRHGHTLTALEEDAAGRVVPVFCSADGSLVREGGFDLLIAGDGRYSALRRLAVGPPLPEFLGIGMARLLVPNAADCPHNDYGQWFHGPARLLSYRLPGGGAYVVGAFPLESPEAEVPPEWRTGEGQAALYRPPAGIVCDSVAWMLRAIVDRAAELHWARLQTAPVLRHALDGRVLFLGDAAHAMVPTLGQGATQAIEDAVLAAAVLRLGGDAAAVGALRDPRIAFVRALSLAATDSMLPGADVEATIRSKGERPFLAGLTRLYTEVPPPEALSPGCSVPATLFRDPETTA